MATTLHMFFSINIPHVSFADVMTAGFVENQNLVISLLTFQGCWGCLDLAHDPFITMKSGLRFDVQCEWFCFSHESDIMIKSRDIIKVVLLRY
jgi:hypothetical protein